MRADDEQNKRFDHELYPKDAERYVENAEANEEVSDKDLDLIEAETKRRAAVEASAETGVPEVPLFGEEVATWDRVQEDWQRLKGRVHEEWRLLSDDEIDSVAGSRDRLIGMIQGRYGMERAEAERQVDDWVKKL